MVKLNVGGKIYYVKNNWREVDIAKLLECDTVFKELLVLTDIPIETLSMFTETQMFAVYNIADFINDPELIEAYVDEVETCNIEIETYEKIELARMVMSGKLYQQLYKMAKVYYPKEQDSMKLLSIGYNLYIQMATFLEHYADMFEGESTSDEIAAGVENISVFGTFATAFELAGCDLLKLRSILDQPALDVYTALHYNYRKSKYIEALYEIKYPTKNVENKPDIAKRSNKKNR